MLTTVLRTGVRLYVEGSDSDYEDCEQGPRRPARKDLRGLWVRFSRPNQGFKGSTTGGVLPWRRIGNWVHIGARLGSENVHTAQPKKGQTIHKTWVRIYCTPRELSWVPWLASAPGGHKCEGTVGFARFTGCRGFILTRWVRLARMSRSLTCR